MSLELTVEDPKKLFEILNECNGNLVIDAENLSETSRPFIRVSDGEIQGVMVEESPEKEEYDVIPKELSKEEFAKLVDDVEYFNLWPKSDSPFSEEIVE